MEEFFQSLIEQNDNQMIVALIRSKVKRNLFKYNFS